VVYGDGHAEELIKVQSAESMLQAASCDPLAQNAQNDMGVCRCHTIFQRQVPDRRKAAIAKYTALPDAFTVGGSVGSSLSALQRPVLHVQEACLTEHQQLIEYPAFTEEVRKTFRSMVKQYHV